MGQQGQGFQVRENSGSLFKNDRKTSDKHPNAKGKALIGGQWYWVSAWTKQGNAGAFQSLAFDLMTDDQVAQYANGGGGGQRQQTGNGYGGGQGGGSRPPQQRQQQQPQRRQADPPPFGDEQQFKDADIPF